ncbi:MAG: hypothetical protein M3019_10405 [Candidatus Dormibacteraeota bacterium]|nr:hypothetical protein [Candidatus Dormibacteraeota bacterium]
MAKFAVVTTVELPEGETIENGRQQLETNIIPMIKQAPGFVSAVFVPDPNSREGLSVVVFENKDQAQFASDNMTSQMPPNIKLKKTEVREVAASV